MLVRRRRHRRLLRQADARAPKPSGRIAGVPYEPSALVWTAWDLGIRDATAIWFAQVVGREIRIIDYYEASGVDLGHYVSARSMHGPMSMPGTSCRMTRRPRSSAPARAGSRCWRASGSSTSRSPPLHRIEDGINAVRMFMPRCWFDEQKCARGIDALKLYRADYDDSAAGAAAAARARLDLARGGCVPLSRDDARPPGGAVGLSPADRVCAAGCGVIVVCGLVSRASVARPGIQERHDGSQARTLLRFALVALGPGSRSARLRLATLARDMKPTMPRADPTEIFDTNERIDVLHRTWHKKRYAENAEYRAKVRAAQRRYRETHKDQIARAPAAEMRERRGASRQASARATARGSAGSATSRSTGSRSPTTTRCCSGRAAPAPSAGDPATRCASIIATPAARCAACSASSATARSGFATTAPRFCWRRPPTCGPRAIRGTDAHDIGRISRHRPAGREARDARHCRCAGKAL